MCPQGVCNISVYKACVYILGVLGIIGSVVKIYIIVSHQHFLELATPHVCKNLSYPGKCENVTQSIMDKDCQYYLYKEYLPVVSKVCDKNVTSVPIADPQVDENVTKSFGMTLELNCKNITFYVNKTRLNERCKSFSQLSLQLSFFTFTAVSFSLIFIIWEMCLFVFMEQRCLMGIKQWMFATFLHVIGSCLLAVITGGVYQYRGLYLSLSFVFDIIRGPFQMKFVHRFVKYQKLEKDSNYAVALYKKL